MGDVTISTHGLSKSFGAIRALDGVEVEARAGTVLGLLGHNGAGKTTLVHILSTVSRPSEGSATVAGFDVETRAADVRRRIGVTAQQAVVDNRLSGRANLVLIARLLGARPKAARRRAAELIEAFDLTASASRSAGTYSGGMRRRLDLAMSLVADPVVLFLDEPTTGLDPVSRMNLWETVEELVRGGTTVLLTTQDLNEADRLADHITVLNKGKVAASGTPAQLKAETGRRSVHVSVHPAERRQALDALRSRRFLPTSQPDSGLIVPVDDSAEVAQIVQLLVAADVAIDGLALSEPTLDDVYLALASPTQAEPARSTVRQTVGTA